MAEPTEAVPPRRYFITAVHSDADTQPDGVEVCLTLDAVEDMLGWVNRFEALGEDAVALLVDNPASVAVRWLTGEPNWAATVAGYRPLLDVLAGAVRLDDEVACSCPCTWDVAPWLMYETIDVDPDEVLLLIHAAGHVRWKGCFDDDDEYVTQAISFDRLRGLRDELRGRKGGGDGGTYR